MNVGDRVRTTEAWGRKYNHPQWIGELIYIRDVGPSPYHPERTHQVKFDKNGRVVFKTAWFDPEDLEIIDDGS